MEIIETSDPGSDLLLKLQSCDPEVQMYISALKSENLKLQKQIVKYQAQQVTLNNRIKALEENQHKPTLNVHFNIEPPKNTG